MKKILGDYVLLALGSILLGVGVYFFEIPNNFVTGGVSSIGLILADITPISPAAWIWILNGFLLLMGFLILGRGTGIKTVFCSMLYSGVTYLFEWVVPMETPFSDEPVLELVYAIIFTALGCALIFNAGGSSGGTDIVALILKKYTRLNIGVVLFATDCLVALSSFFFFGPQTGMLSLLGLFAKSFFVDGAIENFNACKYFIVITTKGDEITDFIMQTLERGVTVSEAVGAFTGEKKTMLHTVCSRREAVRLRAMVKQIDPDAFTIITTSNEIIGYGFMNA